MTSEDKTTTDDKDRIFSAILAIFILFLGAFVLLSPAAQAATKHHGKRTAAASQYNPRYAAIVIDADTGAVLSESGADKQLHPASLVKMMTLMMTFEALESGSLHLRDRITVSRHAASMIPSKLGLDPGESIRVEDAIYAVVTKSANDMAVALAEKLGGTESNFAAQMTRRAHAIGMKNTYFYNASGLHDRRQVSSARDMAQLGYYIQHRYPQYYHYFSTRQFTYQGNTFRNHNRLMETYAGMDGFKTGFIQQSGFNLVASAKRGNRRLIGVVFGGRTTASRNAQMAKLLDQGFARTSGGGVIMASAPRPLTAPPPVPGRKPMGVIQVAALNDLNTAAGAPMRIPADALPAALPVRTAVQAAPMIKPAAKPDPAAAAEAARIAQMNAMLQGSLFQDMIGQGDSDPAVSKRLETGLIAIAALRQSHGQLAPIPVSYAQAAPAAQPIPAVQRGWSVQIGAYGSRAKTDRALQKAKLQLPPDLANVSPVIVPMKTKDGWVFRGRLNGYSNAEAQAACRILKDCLPVAPQAY